ncbi:MAG TPA: phosphotransferase [Acidimicrobiales bacterium]|nr:phosphotransferase [Acidimicrobiales bacterium]
MDAAVANEIIAAEVVSDAVAKAYGLVPDEAALIRRGFNDTYRLDANGERRVARVYLAGKYYLHDNDDIRFELDMLSHLGTRGVPVSVPLPRRDGELLGTVTDASGAARPFALFTWAEGDTVEGHVHPETPVNFGRSLAQVHVEADTFDSPYSRYRLDASYLVDQPERLMAGKFAAQADERFESYRGLFAEMRAFLATQPNDLPAFGYLHGDPHGRNAHADKQGSVTLFDFDHGGFGWRAYDVLTAMASVPEDRRGDFLESYRSVRPSFTGDEATLLRWLPIRMVWDIGDMLAMAPVMGNDFNPPLDEGVQFLDRVKERWQNAGP